MFYVYAMSITAPCFCELCLPDWGTLDQDENFVPVPKVLNRHPRRAAEAAEAAGNRLADLRDFAERDSDSE